MMQDIDKLKRRYLTLVKETEILQNRTMILSDELNSLNLAITVNPTRRLIAKRLTIVKKFETVSKQLERNQIKLIELRNKLIMNGVY